MTSHEMRQMADMIAASLAERLKEDDELLERLYPQKPLSIDEASEWSGIPVGTLYQKKDEIPHSKIGKRLVFTQRGLKKWMQTHAVKMKSVSRGLEVRMIAS